MTNFRMNRLLLESRQAKYYTKKDLLSLVLAMAQMIEEIHEDRYLEGLENGREESNGLDQ